MKNVDTQGTRFEEADTIEDNEDAFIILKKFMEFREELLVFLMNESLPLT